MTVVLSFDGVPGIQGQQGIQGPQGIQGEIGPEGATGPRGSNIETGLGPPTDGFGNTGDFYIDTSNGYYYTNTNGAWSLQGSLQGPAGGVWMFGTGVPSNLVGANGDVFLNTNSANVYQKTSGTWQYKANIKGPSGAAGATGATGRSPVWIAASGAPGSGTGLDGDMYLDLTSVGDVYGPKVAGAWPGTPTANIRGAQGVPGAGIPDTTGVADGKALVVVSEVAQWGYATPAAHAASHKHGGADEVATATPAANAIPKADSSAKLDGWITSGAAAGTPSLRALGATATTACAGDDSRLSDARTPTAHTHAWGDLTTAPTWDGTTLGVGRVQLDIGAAAPSSPAAGLLWWDAADKTVAMSTDIAGTALQLGQEQWVRVVNKTGATVTDGSVVYLSGAQGNRPTIAKADADLATADSTIGVVTADIANNAEGFVCTLGIVRNFNTSGFTAGDTLYLSQTAGAIVNAAPARPVHAVRIGWALNSTVSGSILVAPHVGSDLANLHDVSTTAPAAGDYLRFGADGLWTPGATVKVRHGVANRDSLTLSYNSTTRVVTVTGGAVVYVNGNKYTLANPYTFTAHANTTGMYFFYLDASGAPTISTTPWDLMLHAPLAAVYYNSSLTEGILLYELHSADRDPHWHKNAHQTVGTLAVPGSGFTITGYTLNSDVNADKTMAVASGVAADEDIQVLTTAVTKGSYTIARLTGASGDLTWTKTATMPFFDNGTDIQYNQFTGGTWQLTALSGTQFVNVWVLAVPSVSSSFQVLFLCGQQVFADQASAEAEDFSSVSIGGTNWQEMAKVYRLTYRRAASNGNAGKADLRRVTYIGGGAKGTTISTTPHAATHMNGGTDEVATATAAANAIPKAGAGGTLAAPWLPAMVGDSGSGGTKGAVPAPAAGDATKFLRGDGTWAASSGGLSVDRVAVSVGSSGTTTVDMSRTGLLVDSITCTGTTQTRTLAFSNIAAGRYGTILVINSGSGTATIAWSASDHIKLGSGLPTSIPTGKAMAVSWYSDSTTTALIALSAQVSV